MRKEYVIGVISENLKDINFNFEAKVILLDKENIELYKNQKWDIVILEENILDNKELKELINNTKYLLLEDQVNLEIKLKENINIITYGFNHKSTVTISSIQEDKVIICIQRIIETITGKSIEPIELLIKNDFKNDINRLICTQIIKKILEK